MCVGGGGGGQCRFLNMSQKKTKHSWCDHISSKVTISDLLPLTSRQESNGTLLSEVCVCVWGEVQVLEFVYRNMLNVKVCV